MTQGMIGYQGAYQGIFSAVLRYCIHLYIDYGEELHVEVIASRTY